MKRFTDVGELAILKYKKVVFGTKFLQAMNE